MRSPESLGGAGGLLCTAQLKERKAPDGLAFFESGMSGWKNAR
jgi:hypothetical protein